MDPEQNQTEQAVQATEAAAKASKRSAKNLIDPVLVGIYLLFISVTVLLLLFMLWPNSIKSVDGAMVYEQFWKFFGCTISITDEARVILLVLLSGALGSYVHAATSFVTFAGNRTLEKSWAWWYLMRPFIGGSLALLFYFVIRGGLLSTGTNASGVSIFGMVGLSGLVGMFSKNAIDKLREVFETLFKSEKGKGDEARLDKSFKVTLVEKGMIPLNKIIFCKIPDGKSEKDIMLEDIYKMFDGIVTRVPVFTDKNTIKYIIHQSILYQYIASESVRLSGTPNAFDFKATTLESLLNYSGAGDLIKSSFAIIRKSATIEDAKKAMEALKNCQDVFVTENGLANEPVLGWLTNIEITKNLEK